MESLNLHWLGHPLIELKGRVVKLETRKVAALLIYLSLNPGEVPREVLATMFWQEGSQQKALANLRRTLSSLNASLRGWIEADRETIRLQRNNRLWVDVDTFHQLLSQLKEHHHPENEVCDECLLALDKIVELYRGDFMEGLNLTDAPAFDDWQFFQRDGLRQEFANVLQRLSFGRSERGQWDQAILHARRWVAMDRLHEPANRTLMDLYGRSGQRTAALRQYEELTRLLQEQVEQAPEEETRRLVEQIRGRGEAKQAVESPQSQTSFPLLKTKLYIPTPPAPSVMRSQLLARLDEVEKKALTIVSAPAGFGKTTLLAEWIAQTSLPVAWLSLDGGDNDPNRFLSYLIAALEGIHEDVGDEAHQIMRSSQLTPPNVVLASLLNDLGKVAEPYVFVLDDYQFITEHAVHEALAYLLDHVPSTMHIVIATRADPALHLGRLRAHGQMMELRSQDLRFTSEEATEFLNEVMRLGLSMEDIEALETRTEGWVVGLKMAALSLQGHENASEFIRAFSGSHRYVLDYLVEEVLKRQPAHIQTFLLETSILDKLNGSLCDTLMSEEWRGSEESGQAVLEYLERSNLFVIPLDDHKQWYRYHHLFADLLKARLIQKGSELVNELYRRAAIWLEQNQLLPEAIYYALGAQDFEQFARLVEVGAPAVWTGGGQATLLSWINSIPQELINKRPWLCIWQALLLMVSGKSQQAELLLQVAEKLLQDDSSTPELKNIRGHIASLRGNIMLVSGNAEQAFKQARIALKYLPENNHVMRLRAYLVLFHIYYWTGDLVKADDSITTGNRLARETSNPYWILLLLSYQSRLLRIRGRLRQAQTICQDALDFAIGKSNVYQAISNIHISYADLLLDTHQLGEASHQVRIGLETSLRWTNLVAIVLGYIGLIRLQLCQRDLDGAKDTLMKAEQSANTAEIDFELQALLTYSKIRLWLAQGDTDVAADWLKNPAFDEKCELVLPLELIQITRARVMIALGMFQEAEFLLAQLISTAESGERYSRLIEILALEAIVFQAQGKIEDAVNVLIKCLTLAEPEGSMRIFIDEGEPMKSLFKEVLFQFENKRSDPSLRILFAFVQRLSKAING